MPMSFIKKRQDPITEQSYSIYDCESCMVVGKENNLGDKIWLGDDYRIVTTAFAVITEPRTTAERSCV